MGVVTYPGLKPYDWTKANLHDRVAWTRRDTSGRFVTGSLFTIAWLDWADGRCMAKYGTHIVVIQPPFNEGVPASAGTHDLDRCMDVYLPGVGWWASQRFLRSHFGAFWYRHPPLFSRHLHGFPAGAMSLGLPVGIYVPGQWTDYLNKAYGLANMHTPGSDDSWGPKDRGRVWPHRHYIQEMIDAMPLSDNDVQRVAKAAADELLGREVGPKDDRTPVRDALYKASNVPGILRAKVDQIIRKIGA